MNTRGFLAILLMGLVPIVASEQRPPASGENGLRPPTAEETACLQSLEKHLEELFKSNWEHEYHYTVYKRMTPQELREKLEKSIDHIDRIGVDHPGVFASPDTLRRGLRWKRALELLDAGEVELAARLGVGGFSHMEGDTIVETVEQMATMTTVESNCRVESDWKLPSGETFYKTRVLAVGNKSTVMSYAPPDTPEPYVMELERAPEYDSRSFWFNIPGSAKNWISRLEVDPANTDSEQISFVLHLEETEVFASPISGNTHVFVVDRESARIRRSRILADRNGGQETVRENEVIYLQGDSFPLLVDVTIPGSSTGNGLAENLVWEIQSYQRLPDSTSLEDLRFDDAALPEGTL